MSSQADSGCTPHNLINCTRCHEVGETAALREQIADLTAELERDGWKKRCMVERENNRGLRSDLGHAKAAMKEAAEILSGGGPIALRTTSAWEILTGTLKRLVAT